jgi:hypothetical protein
MRIVKLRLTDTRQNAVFKLSPERRILFVLGWPLLVVARKELLPGYGRIERDYSVGRVGARRIITKACRLKLSSESRKELRSSI